MKLYKSGETIKKGGTFVEVGHGGGKIKHKYAKTVVVADNESLPTLEAYKKENRTRQHNWKRRTN